MKRHNSSETGQVLVLMAFGFIVFLGFVALALDGGMAYSDRRRSQNGADAASLAGGGSAAMQLENSHVFYGSWNCNDARIAAAQNAAIVAAIGRADDNEFVIDDNVGDRNGVTAVCGQEMRNGVMDKFIDVTTQISMTTDTSFMQLFFGGELTNNVQAVTRVRPRSPLVFGNAVVALNPANCQGQQNGAGFHGNAGVEVTGGGIFSNGCLQSDGGPSVTVTDGGVVGRYIDGGDKFNPPAQNSDGAQLPPSSYDVPLPDCNAAGAHNNFVIPKNGDTVLAPGLYCLSGNLDLQSGSLIGHDVTIYIPTGSVTINGNALLQIDAPERTPNPSPAIPGVVIYMPPTNSSKVKITGTSDNILEGTILAPSASISLLGSGDSVAYNAQVIGWNVEFGGTAYANVVFDENRQYSKPSSLELYK